MDKHRKIEGLHAGPAGDGLGIMAAFFGIVVALGGIGFAGYHFVQELDRADTLIDIDRTFGGNDAAYHQEVLSMPIAIGIGLFTLFMIICMLGSFIASTSRRHRGDNDIYRYM